MNSENSKTSMSYVLILNLTDKIDLTRGQKSVVLSNLRICVKSYGFLYLAKNIGIHATKGAKNLSNKYSQKLLDSPKKSNANAIKTGSKRAIQKTTERTGDLIGNKNSW